YISNMSTATVAEMNTRGNMTRNVATTVIMRAEILFRFLKRFVSLTCSGYKVRVRIAPQKRASIKGLNIW
ncbi:MAG: hypothetical protein WBA70_12860, partial [Thermodesulfobacteriota bacterium]